MPNVRASSGMIGTTYFPISGCRSSSVITRTEAIVVETSRPCEPDQRLGEVFERRRLEGDLPRLALRQIPAQFAAALVEVSHLRAVFRRAVECDVVTCFRR